MTKPDLDRAYALETPQDLVRLYGDWAESYDESFAESSGYLLPTAVAEAFHVLAGKGPVLDLGAGTGLVGEVLAQLGVTEIDGTDISAQMLAEAALKDVYDNLFEGDLTAHLPCDAGHYNGIISAGTFTHGHVGPQAFDEVLRVAAPGALVCLSVNAAYYEAQGFAAKLEALEGSIQALTLQETPIYDQRRSDAHSNDKAMIVSFRKA